MGIKLKIKSIKDRVENGNLLIYVPFDIDLKKNINNYLFFDWIKSWGFRYKYNNKLNETHFIIPKNFDLKEVFYKREQFEYCLGFNKTRGKSMSESDFLEFVYMKFLKSMGITKKTTSFARGIQGHKKTKLTEMMYYHFVCNKYDNKIDDILYLDEIDLNEKSYQYLKNSLLKTADNKALILYKNREELPDLDNLKSYLRLKKINNLQVKSSKGDKIKDFMIGFEDKFSNHKMAYNALFGIMFSNESGSIKIDFSNKEDFEKSNGVYLTNTLTKLKELGILFERTEDFHSNLLQFYYIKSFQTTNPYFLLNALVEHCKKINEIYDNKDYDLLKDDNVKIFLTSMMEDLILGMKSLGLFLVEE
jgi:hypothetical protein